MMILDGAAGVADAFAGGDDLGLEQLVRLEAASVEFGAPDVCPVVRIGSLGDGVAVAFTNQRKAFLIDHSSPQPDTKHPDWRPGW